MMWGGTSTSLTTTPPAHTKVRQWGGVSPMHLVLVHLFSVHTHEQGSTRCGWSWPRPHKAFQTRLPGSSPRGGSLFPAVVARADGTVRVFRQKITLEDATGSHPARLKRAGVWSMAFLSGGHFLTGSLCKLRPNTEGRVEGRSQGAGAVRTVKSLPMPAGVCLMKQHRTSLTKWIK
jgi:hypothetical protein